MKISLYSLEQQVSPKDKPGKLWVVKQINQEGRYWCREQETGKRQWFAEDELRPYFNPEDFLKD